MRIFKLSPSPAVQASSRDSTADRNFIAPGSIQRRIRVLDRLTARIAAGGRRRRSLDVTVGPTMSVARSEALQHLDAPASSSLPGGARSQLPAPEALVNRSRRGPASVEHATGLLGTQKRPGCFSNRHGVLRSTGSTRRWPVHRLVEAARAVAQQFVQLRYAVSPSDRRDRRRQSFPYHQGVCWLANSTDRWFAQEPERLTLAARSIVSAAAVTTSRAGHAGSVWAFHVPATATRQYEPAVRVGR